MLTLDVQGLDGLADRVTRRIQDRWTPAVHAQAATVVAATWAQLLSGSVAPPMTDPIHRPDLVDTIQVHATPDSGIVRGDTDRITTGTAARDMKSNLLHGPKSRAARRGGRYTIVPLRHQAETIPTPLVLDLVMQGVTGADVGPKRQKPTPVGNYVWKTGLYSRMRLGGGAGRPAGPVTFRTVSTRSAPASWWYPARPGQPLMQAVWQAARPVVVRLYTEALRDG